MTYSSFISAQISMFAHCLPAFTFLMSFFSILYLNERSFLTNSFPALHNSKFSWINLSFAHCKSHVMKASCESSFVAIEKKIWSHILSSVYNNKDSNYQIMIVYFLVFLFESVVLEFDLKEFPKSRLSFDYSVLIFVFPVHFPCSQQLFQRSHS